MLQRECLRLLLLSYRRPPLCLGGLVALGFAVCRVLDLSSPHKVAERLDPDELTGIKVRSGGQTREMTFINESGLYNVILRSDKPEAKPFRKWVTGTVLPTIRKTGAYSTNALRDPKAGLAEAKVKNARARVASIWLKLAQTKLFKALVSAFNFSTAFSDDASISISRLSTVTSAIPDKISGQIDTLNGKIDTAKVKIAELKQNIKLLGFAHDKVPS